MARFASRLLYHPMLSQATRHEPVFLGPSRDAQNLCAVTKGDNVFEKALHYVLHCSPPSGGSEQESASGRSRAVLQLERESPTLH